ncbi:hypothetical protein GLW08_20420 [Pontibacillus yanchengensis]|uniref:Uncharacterized protein n=2 Tax=Pontibacillus yanchengensis TaxID=462910 RepID=A0A6I5A592_9BACI|nr:hypothetical protein [Pontibacillus yanchengensis]MYL35470.1 hypothetical protein [Pontibacillus yanchengensis]MYL55670.1 hypothetical protein [Pontibacillus yanchengensis]
MNDDVNQKLSNIDNSMSDIGSHIDILKKSLAMMMDDIYTQLVILNVLMAIIALTLIIGMSLVIKKYRDK